MEAWFADPYAVYFTVGILGLGWLLVRDLW